MRVCFLTPVLDAFKGGNHLPLLSAMQDVSFTILTNRSKPDDPKLPKNVTVETLKARTGPYYYGIGDALFAKAVLHRYPALHPFWKQFDAIHLNQTMGPALLALQKTGVPICFLIHHPVSADRQIALEESSLFEGLRWRLKYWSLIRWQKRFCNTLSTIITVSTTAADRIAKDYGCDRSKISVVPNGVEGSVFTPGDLTRSDFDVIALGSFIHPRKGFRYLLEAYKAFAAKGLRIADVGRRSQEQQRQLQLMKGVQTFGTVTEEKLLELLKNSSVLISTSLYEGFGLSLIEALACGRPAFAFDGGAVREVLSPIDPQLVIPRRDTNELVRRVNQFLELPAEERKQKGEQYRQAALHRYTLKASAVALQSVYAGLHHR